MTSTPTINGFSIEDVLAEAKPRRCTVRVLFRQELLEQHRDLDAELARVAEEDQRENRDPLSPAIAAQVVQLERDIEEARRPFTFEAIGVRRWMKLLAQHPPTKAQLAVNSRLDHNPDTFPLAAMAASCVSPALTAEQVGELEDIIGLSQWNELWVGCLDANTAGGGAGPKSLGAGAIHRTSAAFARSATVTASPDLSSLDG